MRAELSAKLQANNAEQSTLQKHQLSMFHVNI